MNINKQNRQADGQLDGHYFRQKTVSSEPQTTKKCCILNFKHSGRPLTESPA